MRNLFIFIFFLSLYSCEINKSDSNRNLILSLDTSVEKENFLAKIFDEDQNIRDPEIEYNILKRNEFDRRSEEFQSHLKKMYSKDSLNVQKLILYFESHGFPQFENKNSKAYSAIFAVAIHQNKENQRVLFPWLYKGYNQGYFEPKFLSSVLMRMHDSVFNKRLEINENGQSDDELIRILIEKLNLEKDINDINI